MISIPLFYIAYEDDTKFAMRTSTLVLNNADNMAVL
jgi:hypothetical protein